MIICHYHPVVNKISNSSYYQKIAIYSRGLDPLTTNSAVQDDKVAVILDFCSIPRSRKEIQAYLGLTGRNNFNDKYLKPLLASEKLKITIPDKPNSRLQKYVKA